MSHLNTNNYENNIKSKIKKTDHELYRKNE